MTLFLISFLTVYGGMHLYALLRIQRAFGPGRVPLNMLRLMMGLAVCSPFLIRMAETSGLDAAARALAWVGYCWMGYIFLLVTLLLVRDTALLAFSLLSRTKSPPATERPSCGLVLLAALAASLYGFYEAGRIRTERLTITTPRLPPSVGRIRVVQISDVHLGLIVGEERLERILAVVRRERPHILVSTGDLLDGRLSRQEGSGRYLKLASMLAAVTPPSGMFAVTGNHEFYAGLEQSLEVTKRADFRVLRNESVQLDNGLVISGCDDPAGRRMPLPPPPGPSEAGLLRSLPPDRFRLHLKHRPEVEPGTAGLFDLQLSGHTHHGQLFPFFLLTRLSYPLADGTRILAGGSLIHTSRGSGTWGPPIRFLAPPEVTVIDIVAAPPAPAR